MTICKAFQVELELFKLSSDSMDSKELWYGESDLNNQFMVLDSCNTAEANIDSYLFHKFDKEWHNKRPVLIKNLHKRLSSTLWTPQSFSDEFGELQIDLINCRNQRVVPNVPLKEFWRGFENVNGKLS
jgi:hypothetical protein